MAKRRKVLWYDIETSLMKAYTFHTGKQYIGHSQLVEGADIPQIMMISYAFNDDKVKTLTWDYEKQDPKAMLNTFDLLIAEADVVIGKNSDNFDNKFINTGRLFNPNSVGMPQWLKKTDDLQKQMKKHFRLPSQSLDYISKKLGLGGKDKMEMQDWINILEKKSIKSWNKMLKYSKKDVEDMRSIWKYAEKHFIPKHNIGVEAHGFSCRTCGSTELTKNGTRISGGKVYQTYMCSSHLGYAGKQLISSIKNYLTE